jgi:hypothetical protein
VGELAGAGEGGCRKRGESRMVEGERRIEKLDRRWRLRLEEEGGEGGRRRRGKMGRPIRTRTPTRRCAVLPRGRPDRSIGLPPPAGTSLLAPPAYFRLWARPSKTDMIVFFLFLVLFFFLLSGFVFLCRFFTGWLIFLFFKQFKI